MDEPQQRRATVKEAAEMLGVSEAAIRARVRRGSLRSERDEESGRVYVYVDADDARSGARAERVEHAEGGDRGAMHPATRELIDELRRQLEQEREANRENRRLLMAALEHARELEAPRERRGSPESAGEAGEGSTPPPEREHRSWWRRFFGLR